MRPLFFLLLFLTTVFTIQSQEIGGSWNANLEIQGIQLPLVFHINKTSSGNYVGAMDSPKQSALGIPVTIKRDNLNLTIILKERDIKFEGTIINDELIEGTFAQRSISAPLSLKKGLVTEIGSNRPQEPKAPFPYDVEEVVFENEIDKIKLSGTLTVPKNDLDTNSKYPAVILISGSGPQNRNEEVLGHKPFLVISDYLTRNGIAVLRYDDRGTAKSEGSFSGATSEDFANDTQAAFNFLKKRKEIDSKNIGLIGHSEGGFIAPMLAVKNKDIAFIILLAGPGVAGDKLLVEQGYDVGKARGRSEEELQDEQLAARKIYSTIKKYYGQSDKLNLELRNLIKSLIMESVEAEQSNKIEELVDQQLAQLENPWLQYFINSDPFETLKKVQCPVLALNGDKDIQVSSKSNLSAIKSALQKGGNTNATIIELPNLNHFFQRCETCSISEYSSLKETISPFVLELLSGWIIQNVMK